MSDKLKQVLRGCLVAIALLVLFLGIKTSLEDMKHEKNVMNDLKFVTEMEGKKIEFSAWKASREKTYYLVLPAGHKGAELKTRVTYDDRFYTIYIDDKAYSSGEIWIEDLKEEVHSLRIEDCLGRVQMERPFQVLASDNVPAIMVTVEAEEELLNNVEYANKQYVEKGKILMLSEEGKILLEDEMERFKVRGNLTATMGKKPFTFTLSNEVSLLGMSVSKNWHLLANAADGSHSRNKIMLDWAAEMMDGYQVSGTWVDVFLNGKYQGLYFLTETIEVSESRLNLDTQNSVLAEMELHERAIEEMNYLVTQQGHYWVVHEEVPLSEKEKEEIKTYLDDIESALYSEDGISENSGRRLDEMLDFDSWTDAWLLEEMSADHDLGTTSQFGIIEDWENRSILRAGPAWDFDITLGNGMVPWAKNPRNLAVAIPNTRGIISVTQNKWLSRMYCHQEFREMLIEKFQTEVQPKVARLIEYEMDQYAQIIRRPATLDALRWLGNDYWFYFTQPADYSLGEQEDYQKYDVLDCHMNMIKDFLKEKEQFLQELWVDGVEFDVIIEERNGEGMALDLNNDEYIWVPKESIDGNDK